eukprot:6985175-Pyramimonas_sp.AAC.1
MISSPGEHHALHMIDVPAQAAAPQKRRAEEQATKWHLSGVGYPSNSKYNNRPRFLRRVGIDAAIVELTINV